jgi:hypothetical protein
LKELLKRTKLCSCKFWINLFYKFHIFSVFF